MRRKKAIYYQNNKGQRPVEELFNNLDVKIRAKLLARIEFLEEHWHELRRPLIDIVEDDLWELRVQFAKNKFRVIYAYMFEDYIVLLHGFIKTTGPIQENDKLLAKKRMIDFQIQYNAGKLKLKKIEYQEIKMKNGYKTLTPKTVAQHIEEEYRKSPDFRKAYDEEVARLRIAHQIEKLRKKRGLTQSGLARKLKTTQQTVSRLEDANNIRFSVRTLSRIATALNSRLCVHFIPI